jgi:Holliday junction resolvase RusA-like endonuclease
VSFEEQSNLYKFVATIPGLPKTMNAIKGHHWRTYSNQKKRWARQVARLTLINRPPRLPLKKVKLTLTRLSSAAPDYDNLVASFKPIIDCLVDFGFIVNDSMDVVGQPTYAWQKVKPLQGAIRIEIEELPQ